MSKFEKRFFTVLREQTAEERAAMEASLDTDTNPEEFDTEVPEPRADSLIQQASQIMSQQAVDMKNQIDEWTARCEEFKKFLNDTNPGSITSTLKTAIPETIFDAMRDSLLSDIIRLAGELGSLAEEFKGHSARAEDPKYKGV